MESVPLMWGPVTASPVGIEPMTIFGGGVAWTVADHVSLLVVVYVSVLV